MQFSKRTGWNTEESELARALRLRQTADLPLVDLTASNPTRCGFDYPAELLTALSNPTALDYNPDPRGSQIARAAVCGYYADHTAHVTPNQILLTTSTSEAYSYLFKLLCDPGDAVLVPQPCYPLFDFLADAEVIRLAYTPFIYDHGWLLDIETLCRQITPQTRALVLVHPNNPTGHFTSARQARELAEICRAHNLALIVDEVFLDYAMNGSPAPHDQASFAARDLNVLTFVVSGISKIAGLPQMKAAWIAACGPGSGEAMARLEVLADTYLSMNAPVQCALPSWLTGRNTFQNQVLARLQQNLAQLEHALASQPETWVERLSLEGGWYAVLRIPAWGPDERTALQLLTHGVYVHPGHFFGMPQSGWLVVSLLTPPADFSVGIEKIIDYFKENQKSYLNH